MKKNNKHVLLNIVLSLCLCLSLFFGSCMTADAAYATGRFPFNMTNVSNSYFEEYSYFYFFRVQDESYTYAGGSGNVYPFSVVRNGSVSRYSGRHIAVFSDRELFLFDDSTWWRSPILVFSSVGNVSPKVTIFHSSDAVNWTSETYPTLASAGNVEFVFDPQKVYVMSNSPIKDYKDNARILYQRNMPDSWIANRGNGSFVTNVDDVDISNNTSTSGSDTETLPEESDGTFWGNLWSYLAKVVNGITSLGSNIRGAIDDFKDAMIDKVISGMNNTRTAILQIIDNVQELPDKFVEAMNNGEPFSFFDTIFENVNLKMLDIVENIISIPQKVADAIVSGNLGELLESIFNTITSIPSSIVDLIVASPFYQLVSDIALSVLDTANTLLSIPFDIGKEIGKEIRIVFNELFVPSSEYLQEKMEGLSDRFPFIGSTKSIIFSIGTRIKELGANPPVVTVPLSKTFLASYGVNDCTMTFEWFAPYRSSVLFIESAFLCGAFVFRMYFGIKHIFNATSNVMPYMYVESWRS